jgi:hypothetical protein
MKPSLEQLIADAIDLLKAYPDLRIGQVLSNLLQDYIEDIDPFYDDRKVKSFLLYHYKDKKKEITFAIKLLRLIKELY